MDSGTSRKSNSARSLHNFSGFAYFRASGLAWHPQAARVCIGSPPPRTPDTFTFSDQLRHQLGGFALTAIENLDPWERVLDFQFAKRPGDRLAWHLYVEIIGK